MNPITDVAVIGAGNMGHGFAAHFALNGRSVALYDHRESNLESARERIRDVVSFLDERNLTPVESEDALADVTFRTDLEAAVRDADFVLETVTEDLEAKRKLFQRIGDVASEDAILASNTSSLRVTDIADGAPSCGDRIVGCHWWYPPYLLEPVEVVRGAETSDETMDRTAAFVEDVDRKPVVVERDVPGFVWNRIQSAVVRECMHLAAEGVASIEDIDTAIRDGYARRTSVVGPFETMDIAGLDLFRTVTDELYPHLCDDDEPSALFDDYLDRGRGGIADGAGFHDYDSPDAVTRRRDERLAALRRLYEG
ncbi:3-hydroxyacyl-CoA dehydrogenase family protein [Haladaptatus sp. DYF46]|uniref:3-hydroxyacyl-CoA dehydrogenase family protein n=1 Tax=Haladaptatus sp. DYF46 TaxID=2886041 RepID=UPI001E468572|nr:3-hydroxyacyl-CoA dehydrogenase family protein [Haladaptatus sp. DYF46]